MPRTANMLVRHVAAIPFLRISQVVPRKQYDCEGWASTEFRRLAGGIDNFEAAS